MYPHHAQQIVFSPTGTTRKVLQSVLQGLSPQSWSAVDLTRLPAALDLALTENDSECLTVIGVPVYAGRVPALARERMLGIDGMGRKAVLVVVYGNRAYDDALLELRDLALECGFVPIAAAAFVGEHSFSTSSYPIAAGRPDQSDLALAVAFGKSVQNKLRETEGAALDETLLQVPGNFPYRDGVQAAPISPETDPEKCVLCEACVEACPVDAISLTDETVKTDTMLCLRCCACTRVCPTGARAMLHPRILELGRVLHEKHAQRREPELFLL
jgi:ferredoxin